MKKLLYKACLSVILMPLYASAQTAPGTDILIGDLSVQNGTLSVSNIVNITDRDGYDNQPFFLPDGQRLFYTSELTDDNGQSQTDAIMYHLSTGETKNLTASEESEYSPTLMPDGQNFSVIHVTAEGKQKFWAYSLNDKNRWELLKEAEPVGYHAWVNNSEVIMFILGEPHTLQLADVSSGKARVLDANIGASLYQFPGKKTMTYTRGDDPTGQKNAVWSLMEIDTKTNHKKHLTSLPGDAYYYAWTPDGKAIAANGSTLLQWDSQTQAASSDWNEFAQLKSHCQKGFSRLAVNASQSKIAMVCSR